jgi:hypothetical protein
MAVIASSTQDIVDCGFILIQIDSMTPRRGPRNLSKRIHSSLEPENHRRLLLLAKRDRSSVSRLIELAVIEFLDRRAPPKSDPDQTNMRS